MIALSVRCGLAGVAVCAAAFAAGTEGDGGAPEVSAEAAVLSAYMWRGQTVNDEAVLQPALSACSGDLCVGVWANVDLTERSGRDAGEVSEVDLTVSYCTGLGPVSMELGFCEYLFPNQTAAVSNGLGAAAEGTREAFVTASFEEPPVVPSLSLYWDFDEVRGCYISFGLSREQDLGGGMALTMEAVVGYGSDDYNAFYFGVGNAGWNDLGIGAALAFRAADSFSIAPGIRHSALLDGDIRDAADEPDRTVFELILTCGF